MTSTNLVYDFWQADLEENLDLALVDSTETVTTCPSIELGLLYEETESNFVEILSSEVRNWLSLDSNKFIATTYHTQYDGTQL